MGHSPKALISSPHPLPERDNLLIKTMVKLFIVLFLCFFQEFGRLDGVCFVVMLCQDEAGSRRTGDRGLGHGGDPQALIRGNAIGAVKEGGQVVGHGIRGIPEVGGRQAKIRGYFIRTWLPKSSTLWIATTEHRGSVVAEQIPSMPVVSILCVITDCKRLIMFSTPFSNGSGLFFSTLKKKNKIPLIESKSNGGFSVNRFGVKGRHNAVNWQKCSVKIV